jgi:hypothetical protein
VDDYKPVGRLKQRKQIFIFLSIKPVQQKMEHEIFFHLVDLTLLNSWILLSSCGAKYTHRDLRLLLVKNWIEEAGNSQDHPPRLVVRTSVGTKNVLLLEGHNKH